MLRVKTPALQKFAVPGRCVGCGDTNVERAGGLEQTCSGSYSSFGTVYSLDVGVRFRMCWPCQLARNKEDRQGTAGCVAAAAVIAVAGSTAYAMHAAGVSTLVTIAGAAALLIVAGLAGRLMPKGGGLTEDERRRCDLIREWGDIEEVDAEETAAYFRFRDDDYGRDFATLNQGTELSS